MRCHRTAESWSSSRGYTTFKSTSCFLIDSRTPSNFSRVRLRRRRPRAATGAGRGPSRAAAAAAAAGRPRQHGGSSNHVNLVRALLDTAAAGPWPGLYIYGTFSRRNAPAAGGASEAAGSLGKAGQGPPEPIELCVLKQPCQRLPFLLVHQ